MTTAFVLAGLLLGAAPQRFAVVLGNNAPLAAEDAPLRFADDDAVAMAELLAEAGVEVRLLVTPDDDTRALLGSAAEHGETPVIPAGPPSRAGLETALADLNRTMAGLAAQGTPSELILYYSGHGSVEGDEGVVALADGHLSRSALHRLLKGSRAQKNHVIIDACRSYFLAYAKGPGGRRLPFDGPLMPGPRGSTGFILSTSSDRETHEWARYGGGIFSHEVRSALRGAADVDGDGRVTYAELGAFLETANRTVPNPQFRPDFVVRPPDALDTPVLAWGDASSGPTSSGLTSSGSTPSGLTSSGLTVDETVGPLWVEGPLGERLADLNPGSPVALRLPRARPLFVHRKKDDLEQRLESAGWTVLSTLAAVPADVVDRGALHLAFESLFQTPFAAPDVSAYRSSYESAVAAQLVVAPAPARPAWLLPTVAAGSGAMVLGGGALTLLGLAQRDLPAHPSQRQLHARNDTIDALNAGAIALYVVGGLAAAAAGVLWWTDSPATPAAPAPASSMTPQASLAPSSGPTSR